MQPSLRSISRVAPTFFSRPSFRHDNLNQKPKKPYTSSPLSTSTPASSSFAMSVSSTPLPVEQFYWWAYQHPIGLKFWDQPPIVEAILYGNYTFLKNEANNEVCSNQKHLLGKHLQIACAYGDQIPNLCSRMPKEAPESISNAQQSDVLSQLDIIDVTPAQLQLVRDKLTQQNMSYLLEHEKKDINTKSSSVSRVCLHEMNATALMYPPNSFDSVLLFLLLHELPNHDKRSVLLEALRVVKPSGKIVIVDFHKPKIYNVVQLLTRFIFFVAEPFAKVMLEKPVSYFLPPAAPASETTGSSYNYSLKTTTYFGDLFQKTVITKLE